MVQERLCSCIEVIVAAATAVLLAHLNGLSDGDPDMACATRLDPVTGEGINEDSFLYDECIKSVEEQLDENEWEGVASALTRSEERRVGKERSNQEAAPYRTAEC